MLLINGFQIMAASDQAFSRIKETLASSLVVNFYDGALPTELLTDAARTRGLGYALVQRGEVGRVHLIQC